MQKAKIFLQKMKKLRLKFKWNK